MALSRRRLLQYGLGGAILLASGGAGIALQETLLRTPAHPLKALDARTYSILAAIADRIVPGQGGFPSARELQVAEKVDALLSTMHPGDVGDLKQALLLIENAVAGLVLDGRPRPFTRLEPAEQDEALRAWQRSRLKVRRTAWAAIHGLCVAAYYASPETYRFVGYPGPPDFGNLAQSGGGRP